MINFTLYRIERLHRFVYDELYVQEKDHFTRYEEMRLREYEHLVKLHPNWRLELIQMVQKKYMDYKKMSNRVQRYDQFNILNHEP